MFLPSAWDTSSFLRLTYPCNIILLKWMKNLETYAPLSPLFGLYRYARLSMGVLESLDIAQEFMENLLRDLLQEIVVYIDDILVTNHDWKSRLILLDKVLARLKDAGVSVNPLKCEWAVQETDFLGHWMTSSGIKPWKKKVDAIIRMERLQSQTQLHLFLGMVNYYHDMWPR